MVFPQYTHYPFPSVSEEAATNSITFMAPSKTFNIAGIVSSYAIVPDDSIRQKFYTYLQARELNEGTIFSYEATHAAYTFGAEWLQQMRIYVAGNIDYIASRLRSEIPAIKPIMPQASFLVWLDCRELGLNQTELVALFKDRAGLALNDGTMFGPGGEGFMRMNAGCPRSILKEAIDRLGNTLSEKS
jgi:cystathionine beta-lyase